VQVNATDGSSLRHVRELIFEYTQASKVLFPAVPLPRNITSPHRQSPHWPWISGAFPQPACLCRSDSNVKCLETLPMSTFASSLSLRKTAMHTHTHTHTHVAWHNISIDESRSQGLYKILHAAPSDMLSPSLSIYLTPCSRTNSTSIQPARHFSQLVMTNRQIFLASLWHSK
jgi:hypothetical protein